jgi:hypothetical protein
MSLWAFRFLLWYICILLVQPQNRFTFLWPLKIADLSFMISVGLHVFSCMEGRRPLIRLGPATMLALALIYFTMVSQYTGKYQVSSAWNAWVDVIVKNALLLIMIEAMATTVERVWAVQMTALFSTLWWVKAGLQLARSGATYAGDRIMGGAVGLIENPNGFAYMMCVFLPLYLYAYQQATKKWIKLSFLACALASVYIIFETGSRTGMVTLLAVGAFLLPHYGRNRFKSLIAVAVAIAFIYPLTSEGNKQRFRTIPESIVSFLGFGKKEFTGPMTQDEQSADERKRKNKDTWALIKANPLFGVGVNPDESKFAEKFPMATGQVHCEILMAGKQMGMIGMGLYVGLVGTIILAGRWVRMNTKHWPAVQDMGWTLQLQGVAIAIGGYFCPIPWIAPTLMLAGSASALMRIMKEEKERRVL